MKKLFLISFAFVISTILLVSTKAEAQKNTLTLNTENFDKTIKKGIVLVDFWATWCRPCIMQGPIIDEVADSLKGKVVVGKLDIDQYKDIALRYAVTRIPTTIIFVNGKAVNSESGFQNKQALIRRLENYYKK